MAKSKKLDLHDILAIASIVLGALLIILYLIGSSAANELASIIAGVGLIWFSFHFVLRGGRRTAPKYLIQFVIDTVLAVLLILGISNNLLGVDFGDVNVLFAFIFLFKVFFYIGLGDTDGRLINNVFLAIGVLVLVTKPLDDVMLILGAGIVLVLIGCYMLWFEKK